MNRYRWLAIATIVAGGLAAYASCYSGAFVLDDLPSIVDNLTIRHLSDWARVLRPLQGGGLTVDGRPVLNLSFAVNYALGGMAVAGYHAVNVGIHLLAGLALFGVLRRLMPDRMGLAWAAALIWTAHPLNTEAVTYVAQRAESLMGVFYLLTIYCFARSVSPRGDVANQSNLIGGLGSGTLQAFRELPRGRPESPGGFRYQSTGGGWTGGQRLSIYLSVFCCCLGMATKEDMVSAPLVVLLIDRLCIAGSFGAAWRTRRAYYSALFSSWLLLALLIWHTGSRGGTSGFGSGVSAERYWLTQPGAILHYLRLAVWPRPLVFDYGTVWAANAGSVVVPALIVAGLAAMTVVGLLKNRAWGVLGFLFFGVLAPTCLVPGNRQTLAEQRMYLPLIAVVVGLASILWRTLNQSNLIGGIGSGSLQGFRGLTADGARKPWRLPLLKHPDVVGLAFGTVLLAAVLAAATYRRNLAYHSPLTLYATDVTHLPNNAYAQTNYATALLLARQYQPAAAHFEIALALNPDIPETEDNLANARFKLGQYPEAEAHYRHAIAAHPQFADAYSNLAQIYLRENRVPEARQAVAIALQLKPDLATAHNNLGMVLLREGRVPEAANEFQTATALEPENAEPWMNYGNTLLAAHQPAAAEDAYARAAKLEPTDAGIYYNWAGAETALGRLAEAERLLRQATTLDPGNAGAHENLGNVLRNEHQDQAALPEYAAAVRLAPDDASAHYNYGNGLLRLNRRAEAVRELQAALRLNPGLSPARQLLTALGAAAAAPARSE